MNYAWADTVNEASLSVNVTAWHAIMSASPIVQLTLITLVTMSVVCWAIIFLKKKQFDAAEDANEPFFDVFWRAPSLDDINRSVGDHAQSPAASVFKTGYQELQKMAGSKLARSKDDGDESSAPLLSGIDNLDRALRKAIDLEIANFESRLSILATTGSTGPFIGLFGTVWGIMGAFQKIGATKMASLAVVAPGISEALIATAVGLAAAIPATVGYNHYISKLRKQEMDLNNFAADFLNVAKRNFFKDR
ncbi:MAG: protein TolQ [Pseudobdellovibrionaceae bacterium]|nr:protein TolQ [Bdellovibrionales bacterium]USN49031.1 MAG: protein TolQ [Pseudobdellovibrionaceae bacterium]